MGEVAEMMLDGTLCEGCGGFIDDGEAPGYPRYCSDDCAAGRGMIYVEPDKRKQKRSRQR